MGDTVLYSMVEVSKQEWNENFIGNETRGHPQYFYTDEDEGVIRVWPKPEPGTSFNVSANISRKKFAERMIDG